MLVVEERCEELDSSKAETYGRIPSLVAYPCGLEINVHGS